MPLEPSLIVGATAPAAAPAVKHGLLGTVVKYTTGFVPAPSFPYLKPTPFALTWAAPQPIGIVPPAVFHLDRRWLGVTFHDLLQPFSGKAEPQDVTRMTPEGQALYRYALGQATAARGLTDTQLRKGIQFAERLEAGRVLGLPDKVTLQRGVFALELQRRALAPSHQIQPAYLPGGGVGVSLVYAPPPGVQLPYTSLEPSAIIGTSGGGRQPPGPFTIPTSTSGPATTVANAAGFARSRRQITEPVGLGTILGGAVAVGVQIGERGTAKHALALDPTTPPPHSRRVRANLGGAVAAIAGTTSTATDADAVAAGAVPLPARRRGPPVLNLDPTTQLHVAQVRRGLTG